MPRVNELTQSRKVQQNIRDTTRRIRANLSNERISFTDIANVLEISPQAVSKQFREGNISFAVYTTAQMLLDEKKGEK